MRALLTGALLLLGLALVTAEPPSAQMLQVIVADTHHSSGSGYVGPGDISGTSFTAWWSLRAFNNALAGAGPSTTPVIDVLGATTATSCTIYLKGDGTGNVDLTTAGAGGVGNQCLLGATTFCSVTNTSCTVTQIYDQTGGGRPLVNGTTNPTLVLSCVSGLPCLQSQVATALMKSGGNFTPATGTVSFSGVFNRSVGTGTGVDMMAQNGVTQNRFKGAGANIIELFGGTSGNIQPTIADAAWHAANTMMNGTSGSFVNADGTQTTGTVTGSTTAGLIQAFQGAASTTWLQSEAGFADNVAWTNTIANNVCHNQAAYWGIAGTTC